jgi:hypothetical protein
VTHALSLLASNEYADREIVMEKSDESNEKDEPALRDKALRAAGSESA